MFLCSAVCGNEICLVYLFSLIIAQDVYSAARYTSMWSILQALRLKNCFHTHAGCFVCAYLDKLYPRNGKICSNFQLARIQKMKSHLRRNEDVFTTLFISRNMREALGTLRSQCESFNTEILLLSETLLCAKNSVTRLLEIDRVHFWMN